MLNIENISKKSCTGCGACYSKCPKNAIVMERNDEGFLFPKINADLCVDCGLCYKVCPVDSPAKLGDKPEVYAAWADMETRLKSSSGGFFSIIANYVLEKGGAVCGARYTDDYEGVFHAWAESKEELCALRGSKYLQSETGDTYRQAKEYLEQGRMVLYSGCACQIAGLKNYLGKDYDNLVTADIVCHGVPSPKAYRSYVLEKADGVPIEKMDFREKEYWGWGTAISLFKKDGTVYRDDCYKDPYFVGFLSGLITRECCATCPYTQLNRVGDFTLGDFWGIKEVSEKLDDRNGTSLVIVNTPHGQKLFKTLKENCAMVENVALKTVKEIAKKRNGQLLHPTKENSRRQRFFELLKANESKFVEAYNRAQRYDVGYVGWWDSINYGSALTSFAMNRTLKNMGKSVIMLEHHGIRPNRDSYGLQFARKFFECSKITSEKDMRRFNKVCDTFLVGSDQLWNWWNIRSNNNLHMFFLDFVEKGHRKIAYATSFGKDETDYPDDKRIRVGYNLSKFDAISVREKSGVGVCKREFGVEATHVLDPVFLCDMASYKEITDISTMEKPQKYLFSYILDPTLDKIDMVKKSAQKLGLTYRIAIDALRDNDENSKNVIEKVLSKDPNVLSGLRIEDWLSFIENAEYVVTDSFHGFCFSMIYKRNVIAYINPRRGKARFESIAGTTGLEERLVTATQQIFDKGLLDKAIDYEVVAARLAPEIARSKEWLENAFKKPVRKTSVQELLLWKCIEHDRKIYESNLSEMKGIIEDLQKRVQSLEQSKVEIKKKGLFSRKKKNEGSIDEKV